MNKILEASAKWDCLHAILIMRIAVDKNGNKKYFATRLNNPCWSGDDVPFLCARLRKLADTIENEFTL